MAGMFLYLGGVWIPPTFLCPIHLYDPGMYTPPYAPHSLLCICVFLEALHVVGVVMGSPFCWDTSLTPPLFGGASPSITPPTLSHWFPVHQYVSGISVCYVGIFPSVEGFWGVPPSVGGVRGIST